LLTFSKKVNKEVKVFCSFSFFVIATKKEKRTKRKKMQIAAAINNFH